MMTKHAARSDPRAPLPEHLPYGRQSIDDSDIAAVTQAMRSGVLASGPQLEAFETAFRDRVGAADAVACSSGTAALQLALMSLELAPGDLCIVPPITFLSTATAAIHAGLEVAFCDVDPVTGLMGAQSLADTIATTGRARAILPVHLGGRLCAMDQIAALAHEADAVVIEDASHATGGVDSAEVPVGRCAQSVAATFSFHPVKTMTTGEGGMVTTATEARGASIRRLRNHGVTREADRLREPHSFDDEGANNPWTYEQIALGHNFRMNEMQAALGLSQMTRLDDFVAKRRALSAHYIQLLAPFAPLILTTTPSGDHRLGLHLFSVNIDFASLKRRRGDVMRAMAAQGVSTQVHYIPLYRQPYFIARLGDMRLPGAEAYYSRTLSLPLFAGMELGDVERVVGELVEVLGLR